MVEDIEQFATELEIESLGNLRVLGEREVGIKEAGPANRVTPQSARVARRKRCGSHRRNARHNENGFVGKPLRWVSGGLDSPIQVGPDRQRNSHSRAYRKSRVQGTTAQRVLYESKLPPRDKPVSLERKFIEAAQDKPMTYVIF